MKVTLSRGSEVEVLLAEAEDELGEVGDELDEDIGESASLQVLEKPVEDEPEESEQEEEAPPPQKPKEVETMSSKALIEAITTSHPLLKPPVLDTQVSLFFLH